MRQYFGYDVSGFLVTTELVAGGWPDAARLDQVDSTHNLVAIHRGLTSKANPAVVGFASYDCPCPGGQAAGGVTRGCDCCKKMRQRGIVADGVLVLKPTPALVVDGVALDPATATEGLDGSARYTLVKPPSTGTTIHLQAPDSANGSSVSMSQGPGATLTLGLPQTLSFSAGATPSVGLVAPAQGSSGSLVFIGQRIAPVRVTLTGFAS